MNTDITKVIEEINSDHKMTDERMNKVMTAIINCGDGYEDSDDYLYKKEVDGVEFFVNKIHIGNSRFALHFVTIDFNSDDCENDFDGELWVESMDDLTSAVETIARFDEDPLGFINILVGN